MITNFSVERRWFAEGEETGALDDSTYFLSLADSGGTFIEWSKGGKRDRKRRRVIPGDLWVMAPEQTWWTRREAGKTCIQMSLSRDWLEQISPNASALRPQENLRDTFVAQMLRTLSDTNTLPLNATTLLYQESLATTLILHLIACYGAAPEKAGTTGSLSSARMRTVTDYVTGRIGEKISLHELADLSGLSVSQFSLRFREATGQTPLQFVTALRVEKARELLLTGKHTPADVAHLTGFADQSHLTRHVRRVLGTTPGALQKH